MSDDLLERFLALVDGRRGHFKLESGHHGALWLDLDPLFYHAESVGPLVRALAEQLRQHEPEVVCGPLLGGAFLAQLVARSLRVPWCFTERAAMVEGMYGARYRLPPAFAPRVTGKRVALVDDVMSAGSAMRGTVTALEAAGALPVVAGALVVLGEPGAAYFDARGIPVEWATRTAYDMWPPNDCPLCREGVPLEDPNAKPSDD